MKKLFILLLLVALAPVCSFALPAIYGTTSLCVGITGHLSDDDSSLTGGTWTCSNTAVATVSPSGGTTWITGVAPGVVTITYTFSGSSVTTMVTISATPAAITGSTPTCVGATSTLTDASTGGVWSSSNTGIATVNALGMVTGAGGGSASILYSSGPGCYASIPVNIATIATSDTITGPDAVCTSSSILLADPTTGGTWTSGATAIATVGISSGVVTGASAGTVVITYTVSSACAGSATLHKTITVNSPTSISSISGATSMAIGASVTLTDGTAGGTWSSNNTAVAPIGATTGVVTGIATGTAVITYTASMCGATPSVTTMVSVSTFNGISGHVNFSVPGFYGSVKVWLIKYNPATLMLEAVDSTNTSPATSVYYQFTGLATDSFRVKAALTNADTLVWGYVPTYHTSAYYWHDADVIYHTSGAADINKDINMATSPTSTSGPGFVGGNVTSGANRGTTTGPVAGLLIYLQNATTGAVVQQTTTNASGNYGFSNLPYGTYFVYPELINYGTTPYTSITLSAGTPAVSAASFIEHTVSHTITPAVQYVHTTTTAAAAVVAFPNPTSGKLNILWNSVNNETGIVAVTDITGKEAYKTTMEMNGNGMKQIDLSALTNGLYLITVRSNSISYNNKIEVRH